MFRLLLGTVLLALLCTGCTTSDHYGPENEVKTVKYFIGIPYMETDKTTTRAEF